MFNFNLGSNKIGVEVRDEIRYHQSHDPVGYESLRMKPDPDEDGFSSILVAFFSCSILPDDEIGAERPSRRWDMNSSPIKLDSSRSIPRRSIRRSHDSVDIPRIRVKDMPGSGISRQGIMGGSSRFKILPLKFNVQTRHSMNWTRMLPSRISNPIEGKG